MTTSLSYTDTRTHMYRWKPGKPPAEAAAYDTPDSEASLTMPSYPY